MSEPRRHNPFAALTVLSLGLFMTLLDVTIVNVAIPQLLDSLGASIDEALWVLNGYVLVLGVTLITAGRLGDIYGPRNVYLVGTAIFTVASAACGLSNSPGALIVARCVQGFGAALLTPQPLAIVLPLFPPERRGVAFSINGVVAGVAAVAGPTVGGLIVTHWDWRGIFFVNLPVGIISILLTLRIVPDVRSGRRHRLDLAGVAVATLALTAITFALIEGQRYSWGVVWSFISIPLLLVGGGLLLVLFVWMQKRRQTGDREPLVPFALFRDRNYTLMIIVGGRCSSACPACSCRSPSTCSPCSG
jgi:EmrB/QacA subfamily drug resistance transporter